MFVDESGRDLFGRLTTIFEETDPLVLVLGIGFLAFLIILALMRNYRALILVVLTAAMLAGAKSHAVDSAVTMVRWVVIVILAASVVTARQHPGTPILMYLAFVLLGLFFSLFAPNVSFAVQSGMLFLSTTLLAITSAMVMSNRNEMRRALAIYLLPTLVWVVLGLWYLPDFLSGRMQTGGRFAGFSNVSGAYSLSGALFLPCMLWGVLQRGNVVVRALFGVMFVMVFVMLLLATQRTSLYSGAIACLPLLLRPNMRGFAIILCLVAGTGIAMKQVWQNMSERQSEFIMKRVTDTGDANRFIFWRSAMEEILRDPLVGKGFQSDRWLGQGVHLSHKQRPHNWYIVTWHNVGIFGLLLLFAILTAGVYGPTRIILSHADPEMKDMARLVCGQLLGIAAAGMVDTMGSPSNIQTLTFVLFLVASGRLTILYEQEHAELEAEAELHPWGLAHGEYEGYAAGA